MAEYLTDKKPRVAFSQGLINILICPVAPISKQTQNACYSIINDRRDETQPNRFKLVREDIILNDPHGEDYYPVSNYLDQRTELLTATDNSRLGVRHCS